MSWEESLKDSILADIENLARNDYDRYAAVIEILEGMSEAIRIHRNKMNAEAEAYADKRREEKSLGIYEWEPHEASIYAQHKRFR